MNDEIIGFKSIDPNNSHSRPAQIPIRTKRFKYLIGEYMPDESSEWIMKHQEIPIDPLDDSKPSGYFWIYNINLKCCAFQAEYHYLRRIETAADDDIVVVVSEITTDLDESNLPITKSVVHMVAVLLEKEL